VCCRRPLDVPAVLGRLAELGIPFSVDFHLASASVLMPAASPALPRARAVFVNAAEFAVLAQVTDPGSLPAVIVSDGPAPAIVLRHGRQVAATAQAIRALLGTEREPPPPARATPASSKQAYLEPSPYIADDMWAGIIRELHARGWWVHTAQRLLAQTGTAGAARADWAAVTAISGPNAAAGVYAPAGRFPSASLMTAAVTASTV
jgi:hypothetical protein